MSDHSYSYSGFKIHKPTIWPLWLKILAFGIVLLLVFGLILALFWPSAGVMFGFRKSGKPNMQQAVGFQMPKQIDFAGEPVPLSDMEVYERLDKELTINIYYQSNTSLLIKRAAKWFAIIEPILAQYGLPNDLKYVAAIESSLENQVSPRGAAGFWQIMPATAVELGLEVSAQADERYHLEKATHAACKYFIKAKKYFGNWTSAAASYNMGMAGLSRSMKSQKQNVYYNLWLNQETARYLMRIVAVKQILTHPALYGYQIKKSDLYVYPKIRTMQISSYLPDLTVFALEQGINIKTLKYFNPWLRQNSLNPAGKTYLIVLPTEPGLASEDANTPTPELVDTFNQMPPDGAPVQEERF